MGKSIIASNLVNSTLAETGTENLGRATIRELVRIVNILEEKSGVKFIRMEMGVPGIEPTEIGIQAEIKALQSGVASKYPMIEGIKPLKSEMSRFCKLFLDIEVSPGSCIPTVGSMMGAMAAFLVANRSDQNKEGSLFIDPGFPVQKQQCKILGQPYKSFDVYNFRGEKLRAKLESFLKDGKVSTIIYSNPNNPTWICFTEEELQIIGELATKYDAIVMEDLAYFAMDFRSDKSVPGVAPFQPTVAKYTDNYILLVSSSKAFSYAGQRVGMMVVSDTLNKRNYPDLKRYYPTENFGFSLVYGALYALSAGTTHSSQYALAAILKAANDGEFDFVKQVREYGEKAKIMKQMFIQNGFNIVYDKDMELPIADGFYFTISYPGFTGAELVKELLFYGVSAISLDITGSERSEGLRACVSQVSREQFADLDSRLKSFTENHPVN
jgi:aspartate/methionine/tyrosine aminotransferase